MEVISESTSASIPSPQPEDSINDQLENLSLDEEPQNDTTTDNKNNNNNNGGEEEEVVIRENLEERENDEVENGEEDKEVQSEEVQDEEVVNNVVIEETGNGNENKNGDREKLEREKSKISSSKYPVRPEAEDCSFYVRTGMCKFGMNCKFNHPPNRKTLGGKVKGKDESGDGSPPQKVKDKEDGSDKEGQIDCKYFDRPGGCKFGKACKFNHSRKSTPMIELNFMGLPIRPGEKKCPYYMRNGSCKYGANCRFNHPDPTTLGGSDAQPAYSNGGSVISSTTSQSTLAPWSPPENPPYVPLMFPPTQGVPSRLEWNAYRAPVYPTERNMHMPAAYAINSQSLERNAYTHQQEQILVDEYPERPGQPECSYFLKTGNCKYRSACKFHHPKSANAKPPPCSLSDLGLPLRPDENVCSYYSRYGICKYGPACKYDHPVNYAHSESLAIPAVDHTPALCNSVVSKEHPISTGTCSAAT